jgi:hypothetical protein
MSIISVELRSLYRAIGELAYAIATQDSRVTSLEKLVFQEAAKEELGKDAWVAQDRFEALVNMPVGTVLAIEQTYNNVIFSIKQHSSALTSELLEKFVSLLEKVAGVSGITDNELQWIERFREDVVKLVPKN